MVYRDLAETVISGNVMHRGALQELMVDLDGHGEGVVMKDNPGSVFSKT